MPPPPQWHKSVGRVPAGSLSCGGACYTITALERSEQTILNHNSEYHNIQNHTITDLQKVGLVGPARTHFFGFYGN